MIKYQYQVVRYMHDQFTREFVNVGIVLYSPDSGFLKARMVKRYSRVSQFFGLINGNFLMAALTRLEAIINATAKNLEQTALFPRRIDEITTTILIKDDSALQLSDEVFAGIDVELKIALSDLFERVVERYHPEDASGNRHTDQYVWSKVYKRYFDQQGITKQLKKQSFTTENDVIEFDKSWKNGVWNCYQPLSLDLKTEDSIKSKVYKWSGILKQLETAQEPVKVFFLTSSPKQHSELKPFIDEMLSTGDPNVKVDVIEESEAADFVAGVREQMEASHNSNPQKRD